MKRSRPSRVRRRAPDSTLVTQAAAPASSELSRRQLRYGITMAIRVGCFLAMFLVTGPLRWVLLAAAVVLPYVAVIVASQVDRRDHGGSPESPWTAAGTCDPPRSITASARPDRPDDTPPARGEPADHTVLEHRDDEEQR